MNRRFQLFPDNQDHQRLRVSQSLVDIHLDEGFADAIAPFGVEVAEASDKIFVGSWQELTVRPPLSREQIASFGQTLISFAESTRGSYHEEILFLDHTAQLAEYKAVIASKLNPQSKIS